mmetsp:Transcript_33757/g.74052  ORF Transcript_33757/g.74052 Transcript_33757/m.74052 type:complete len:446 (-) Transcript_33757:618-1955(-)
MMTVFCADPSGGSRDVGGGGGISNARDEVLRLSIVGSYLNELSICSSPSSSRVASQYPPLVTLPSELLSETMRYLSARQVLKVEVTCHSLLYHLRNPKEISSEKLWQSIVSRHWPFALKNGSSSCTSDSSWACSASRNKFLYLLNLRLRPLASMESSALTGCPDRTPSLRSIPQSWFRRSSPFAPRTEVQEVVTLACVEECEHHVEPALVLQPRGDIDFLQRYNFAVLESTKDNTFVPSRLCAGGGNGWEADFEVCFAGWNGGLLGIVACNPDHAASAISWGKHHANCDNEPMHNLWCFDFTQNGQEFDQVWWDRADLDEHRYPVFCEMQNSGVGSLDKSESPTRSPQHFRLRFDMNGGGRLDLFLLREDGDTGSKELIRYVASFDNEDEDSDDDTITTSTNEHMKKYAEDGFEFRPFVGFSPLDEELHFEPEKSYARVTRVVHF